MPEILPSPKDHLVSTFERCWIISLFLLCSLYWGNESTDKNSYVWTSKKFKNWSFKSTTRKILQRRFTLRRSGYILKNRDVPISLKIATVNTYGLERMSITKEWNIRERERDRGRQVTRHVARIGPWGTEKTIAGQINLKKSWSSGEIMVYKEEDISSSRNDH